MLIKIGTCGWKAVSVRMLRQLKSIGIKKEISYICIDT